MENNKPQGTDSISLQQQRENFVRSNIMSDEFLEFMDNNTRPLKTLMSYYQCAIMEVETKFRVLNEQFSLEYDRNPIETIQSRVKSMDSLLRKLRKRNIPLDLKAIEENITDIAGVRVICAFQNDIYRLANCLLTQDDVTLIQTKDYFIHPKESGYRSLHLIVSIPVFLPDGKRDIKVEVQLRTIAMDFWASLEHRLRYKKNIPDSLTEQLSTELLECANITAQLDQRMQDIRNRINEAEKPEVEAKYFELSQKPYLLNSQDLF